MPGVGGSWKHRAALGARPRALPLVLLPPGHLAASGCPIQEWEMWSLRQGAERGREGQQKQGAGVVGEDSTEAGVGVRSSHSVAPADTFLLSWYLGVPFTS